MDHQAKEFGRPSNSIICAGSDVFEPTISSNDETEAKQQADLVEWLNSILPNLKLPTNVSDEELRACLSNGIALCQILNRLRPGSVIETVGAHHSSESHSDNVRRFLAAMDQMKLPRFKLSDLEKGSMKSVLECLFILRAKSLANTGGLNLPKSSSPKKSGRDARTKWQLLGHCLRGNDSPQAKSTPESGSPTFSGEERQKDAFDYFQAAKISELMKSNCLDNAPTQSLLGVMNGILDESIERKSGEIPHRVACLLKKTVQEIERRVSTQAEHLKTQNNLLKAREDKYQSRIKVLEALASGSSEQAQVATNQLQQIKTERTKLEEKKKGEEQDLVRLAKEKDQFNHEISVLKQELEIARKSHEDHCFKMETEAKGVQQELEKRFKEVTNLLTASRNRVKDLEDFSKSKNLLWNKKEHIYQIFAGSQLGALQELRFASHSIKQELFTTQKSNADEFHRLGIKLKALTDASENYRAILAENRKLHNELQELKGNIRVYCRIRPFLPREEQQSIVEFIGEHGELSVANPSKQGNDGQRLFKFNKVYGPTTPQAEVYTDIQPLIRSVLDGYNVCIFAYGQTGSGKTYTMTGPDAASAEEWGVNYRALNDIFHISQARRRTITYEITLQMVEIYNEQVRDLLSSDGSQKRLGILSTSQPNGLAVPDARMHPVKSTFDVVELMEVGLANRASGATALNERSSRSHSIVTIHVCGTDSKTRVSLRGSLHLVDLAGSERVDRSEVTGDRLKEAQHINKSLSALGDVIFALAQKNPHIPYRNSKLTQVLQSSLGGHAKTLMFVQLNPELNSYYESISTLKFAERVSGVELGAARSSKDVGDARELMEQVAYLKDTIAKKDEEIGRLQLLKDVPNINQGVNLEKRGTSSKCSSSSLRKSSIGGTPHLSLRVAVGRGGRSSGLLENRDKLSEADPEILGLDDGEYERFSDDTGSVLSVGTETDGSVEMNMSSRAVKPSENKNKVNVGPRTPTALLRSPRDSLKSPTGIKKSSSGSNLPVRSSKRWA